MVGYQLNFAADSKMIHRIKGSILLIWNLLKFDWGIHIFLGILSMLPIVWGPLSFEYTVDRLFIFHQKLIGLLIL